MVRIVTIITTVAAIGGVAVVVLAQVPPPPPPDFANMMYSFGGQFHSQPETAALQSNFLKTDIGVEFDHVPIGIGPGPDGGLAYFRAPIGLDHFAPGRRRRPPSPPGVAPKSFGAGMFDKLAFGRL